MKKVICYFVIMCFSLACPGMAVLPAALAAELTSDEEQIMFSKEVLQGTLNRIKTNLVADLPSTTELIFLEDIRNELKRQLLEVENTIEEDLAALPDIPMEEFNTEFDEMLDNAKRLIYELDNIIISPSIEQIDSVLELIEILEPEIQGEILATKPELPNRTVDTKANVFKARPVKAIGAPVTEADLAETAEIVFTDTIIAKALELNHDVVDIFTWVKFNIDHEPYYGSIKGSNETLVDMAGNDCDQSSLLLALLRTSGIPSRYVRGDVELKIEDLMNWTGGKTPEAAIAIMQRNKIPTEVIYKFDEPEGVIFDHIWVEAFDGHNWRLMDPSFKTYVYTEGVGFGVSEEDMNAIIETTSSFVNEAGDRISMDYAVINDILETQAANYDSDVGHLNIDEIFGKREIFVSEKTNLPPYLARGIIGDRKPAEEFSVMPDDMRVKVRVIMPGGNVYNTSLPEIAGKRVSIVYVASHDGAQSILDFYDSIYDIPLRYYNVWLRPALQIEGETVATGVSTLLGRGGGSVQIGFIRPGTYDPLNPIWECTNKPLFTGNRYNISITTQRTSLDEVGRVGEEALLVAEAERDKGLTDTDQITDDMLDENLRMAGMFYFGSVDAFSDYVSKPLNIVSVSHISMGYICDEISPVWEGWWIFRQIVKVAKAGLHIDVVRGVKCPTSAIGNRADEVTWMKAVGALGTNMEHAMIEIFYGSKAVSTGMIFAEASKQGVPIHVIKHIDDLAHLAPIYTGTRNNIIHYLNKGYTIMIPQHSIRLEGWLGQGWMVLDEETGAAGYMICGGLQGETTVVNGGSATTIIDHPLSAIETALWLLIPSVGAISAGIGHIAMALDVFVMYPALGPFCLLGIGLGAVIVVAALVTFITIFSNYPLVYLMNRRKYAYV